MPEQHSIHGIDVSKGQLMIASLSDPHGGSRAIVLERVNSTMSIRAWLAGLRAVSLIGVESTGAYHQALVELAHAAGHRVFLIDPRRLKAYRKAIGLRAKTDRCDAELIVHYLAREHSTLHAHIPPSAAVATLQRLLRRRALVVRSRVQLQSSLAACPECRAEVRGALRAMAGLLKRIDATCEQLLMQEPGWQNRRVRLRTIPGIGRLCSSALLAFLERTPYRHADALIAAVGFDPRAQDSGQRHGRRRITKHGPSELRRLLYLAAMSAVRHPLFRCHYQRLRARGLNSTTALIVLARKLLRIAFAVDRSAQPFDAARIAMA